jgi:hypothetical protein
MAQLQQIEAIERRHRSDLDALIPGNGARK